MNMRDVARLVRLPNLLAVAAFQSLLQYGLILPKLEAWGMTDALGTPLFALLVVSTVCLAAGGNAINDYFDVAADRVNRPDRMVVGKAVDRRHALLTHVVLNLVGVFAGLYVSFVLRRASFMLLFVGVPTLLWFYSTHFKRMVLVGNIVVSSLVALTGYIIISADYAALDRVAGGPDTGADPLSSLWYIVCAYCIFAFMSNLSREIIKDMEDVDGDRACGGRTLAIELGNTYCKSVVVLLEAFTAIMLCAAACEIATLPVGTYIAAILIAPRLALCVMVWRAKTKDDFHRASTLSKLIMMAGVASILLL